MYVCRVREEWKMMLSLDVRVDVAWWLEGASGQRVLRWLLLGREVPLSQASWMVENFEVEGGMDQWGEKQWQAYMQGKLEKYERASGELEARGEMAGKAGIGAERGTEVGGMPEPYPAGDWVQLERGAALLASRLCGRQLLAAEAEALLADTSPQLASVWHAAAQLAHLRGRLSITA
ncbi:hypothetical protein P4H35_31055, partial [Paenibacillus taichungensis]|nr:hypothetical protein [Paenibacillus taichungensis]